MPSGFPVLFPAGCRRGGHRASSCPAAEDARGCGTPRCRFGEVCPCHRPSRAQHRAASFFLKGAACGGSAAPEAERGLGGLLRSWKEKGLRCCPAAAAWSPARPAAPPAARLEAVGEKGHFPGCSSSCSHRTRVLGEGSGIQDGSGVFRESSPCVLQSLWPGRCPKEAAVRVAVERETEARSLTGIRLPPLLPGRVAAPRGGGLGSGAKLPGPRGARAEPKVWDGCRAPPGLLVLPQLSRLCPHPLLVSHWGRQEGSGENFSGFSWLFPTEQPRCEPQIHRGVSWGEGILPQSLSPPAAGAFRAQHERAALEQPCQGPLLLSRRLLLSQPNPEPVALPFGRPGGGRNLPLLLPGAFSSFWAQAWQGEGEQDVLGLLFRARL